MVAAVSVMDFDEMDLQLIEDAVVNDDARAVIQAAIDEAVRDGYRTEGLQALLDEVDRRRRS